MPNEGGVLGSTAEQPAPKKKPNAVERALNVDTRQLVGKLAVSFPVLRACASDAVLRALLIAELASLALDAGGPVILPRGARVQTLEPDEWVAFKNELSGLNGNNWPAA